MIKTVNLIGIYGLYNFGCEAIVRGTYYLLKKSDSHLKIVLYTSTPEYDKSVIQDLDIEIRCLEKRKGKLFIQILNRLGRYIHVDKQMSYEKLPKITDNDLFFSIGGDIYTIPKKYLDWDIKSVKNDLVVLGERILKKTDIVIWGASIGPFGNRERIQKYFFQHLKKIKHIYVREDMSYQYLLNNGIQNLTLASDPAYYVKLPADTVYKKSEKLTIGINLSPLSMKENDNRSSVLEFANLLKKIQNKFECNILLLPHVLSPLSLQDNDLDFLRQIYEALDKTTMANTELYSEARGFLDIKKRVHECDIVVSARMHCAVNAICEGVPTVFVCYSQKGYGMANFVYGNKNFAVDLKDMHEKLIEKVEVMVEHRLEIHEYLEQRVKEIRNQEEEIVNSFQNILNNKEMRNK